MIPAYGIVSKDTLEFLRGELVFYLYEELAQRWLDLLVVPEKRDKYKIIPVEIEVKDERTE